MCISAFYPEQPPFFCMTSDPQQIEELFDDVTHGVVCAPIAT